jgi:hypothetical protein
LAVSLAFAEKVWENNVYGREVHVVSFGKQVFLLLLYLPMEASQWDTPKNTVSLYLRKEAV